MKMEYGPREKIVEKGVKSLKDYELLAVLLQTGNRQENVIELSKRILSESASLRELNDYTLEELMAYEGIGKTKALTIISALELSNRLRTKKIYIKKITTPKDAFDYLYNDYLNINNEKVIIIYLDPKLCIISKQVLTIGGFDRAVIDYKEILARGLKLKSSFVIIAHNHPSGDITPSKEDVYTINELERKLNEFGIALFDSIIISDDDYYSMKYGL